MKKALFQSVILHAALAGALLWLGHAVYKKDNSERLVLSMAVIHADPGAGKVAEGIETARADINSAVRTGAEKSRAEKAASEKRAKKEPDRKKNRARAEKPEKPVKKAPPAVKEASLKQPEENKPPQEVEKTAEAADDNKEREKASVDNIAERDEKGAETAAPASAAASAKGKQTGTGAGGGSGRGSAASSGGADGVYSLKEVDGRPKSIKSVRPKYPEYAKKMRIEGSVTVSFVLDEKGRVAESKVIKAAPENVFEKSALDAVAAWRFSPAKKDGRPVKVGMVVSLNFRLDEK